VLLLPGSPMGARAESACAPIVVRAPTGPTRLRVDPFPERTPFPSRPTFRAELPPGPSLFRTALFGPSRLLVELLSGRAYFGLPPPSRAAPEPTPL